MRKLVLLLVVIVIAVALFNVVHHSASHLKGGGAPGTTGAVAPDFSLTDIDGKPVSLSAYRGKVVLLDFWATWCVPCRGEIPHFVDFQNSYRDQGLQVVGISMDDGPKPVQDFYQQFKMNYPVAMGSTQLADSYGGILGLPVTFLIGRDGRIAAKYIGAVEISIVEQEMKSLLQQK